MHLFDNTKVAFAAKTDAALERAYFLFKLIANEPLVRIGSLVANFALKAHLPVEGLIRATVFDHFCSGTTAKESIKVVNSLAEQGVYSVLDYSVEGAKEEISLDACLENTLSTIDLSAKSKHIPFTVFKPTGFGDPYLYEKVSRGHDLNDNDIAAWERIRKRFTRCCEAAKDNGVKLLIDAEESWLQPAINRLVEEMMEKFNTDEVIIFTTVQMYLKDRLHYLEEIAQKAKTKGFKVGIKIVRGAYMEKEAARALDKGYENPVCPSKKATDKNFNDGWRFIIDRLDIFSLYFGSHNEESTYAILNDMKKRKLAIDHQNIWFGQLYGMSDHISFNLAKAGFNVTKYLPFGPVKDVLPYLIRRAEENTSVAGQSIRELELIEKERKRRKLH